MDEDRFWTLIEETRPKLRRSGLLKRRLRPDLDAHRERLVELAPDGVLAFDRTWHELSARAYRYDLWEAAYVINGGCCRSRTSTSHTTRSNTRPSAACRTTRGSACAATSRCRRSTRRGRTARWVSCATRRKFPSLYPRLAERFWGL